MKTSLDKVEINKLAKVCSLNCTGSMRRRLLDLGLIDGATIIPVLKSPAGELTAYEIRGTVIAIRLEYAKNIIIEQ